MNDPSVEAVYRVAMHQRYLRAFAGSAPYSRMPYRRWLRKRIRRGAFK